VQAMHKRHAEIAESVLSKVRERLTGLDAHCLRPNEMARLIEVASRAERLARGVLPNDVADNAPRHLFRADHIRAALKAGLL